MLHTPPLPGIVASGMAEVARLSFRGGAGELGVLAGGTGDFYMLISSGGTDGTWVVVEALPEGFGPVLLAREAYEVLHGGTLNPDGTVTFQGRQHRLRSFYDGANWTAQAI